MGTTVRSIFRLINNKYLVATALFAVIILLTDHNNLFEQLKRRQELHALQAKKSYYLGEIEKTRKALADLSNNPAAIEKYARENFYMKRDNEDVFVTDVPPADPKN